MTTTLSHFDGRPFLTDGGLETSMIFHEGIDLPHFASIVLLREEEGRTRLRRYFETYLAIARDAGAGFILESATWRAGPDWAAPLGLGVAELDELNRKAILMLRDLRTRHQSEALPILVSGCIGPRGDGYSADRILTVDEAAAYHGHQAAIFAETGVDMISAITMTNVPEAIGTLRAATAHGLPCVISFTLETDGRLPTGDALDEAIAAVDAATDVPPAYYMINCAHPTHFEAVLADGDGWRERIRGLRANASRLSHAELDEATELDSGDPHELGSDYRRLLARLPAHAVFGGCCGTDDRHVAAMAQAVVPKRSA